MKNASWLFLGSSTVSQLKVFKGRIFTSFFIIIFFFYSLLTHPNACVFEKRGPCPLEKSTRKTYISPSPMKSWGRQPNLTPAKIGFHLVYSSFHKLISPSFPISLLSHPWQYSLKLKWMAIGNWDTHERKAEVAWAQWWWMGWSTVGLMGLIWEVSGAGWGWDWWWVWFAFAR